MDDHASFVRVVNPLAQQIEATTAGWRHFVKQQAEMMDEIQRGFARQRAEQEAAAEPLGIPRGLSRDAWLSLVAVRVKVSSRKLGKVAAVRFAEVVRRLAELVLDEGDERAAKRIAALIQRLLAKVCRVLGHLGRSDKSEHRAPPDEVLFLVVPHAPPSLPGRLHLTEAALARAA